MTGERVQQAVIAAMEATADRGQEIQKAAVAGAARGAAEPPAGPAPCPACLRDSADTCGRLW
nr:hypothetical protein GCM10017745_44490 [Saccharothrix mutabilis subsp. capreolus]